MHINRLKPYVSALRLVGCLPAFFSIGLGLLDSGLCSIVSSAITLIACTTILGGSFTINHVMDAELDKQSVIKGEIFSHPQPFASGELSKKFGYAMFAFLTLLGLVIASFNGLWVTVFAAFGAIIGLLYSWGIRFKTKPFLDVAANATTFGTASYLAGFTTCQPLAAAPIFTTMWITLLAASCYVLVVMIDGPDDKRAGILTTVTKIGMRNSLLLSLGLYATAIMLYLFAIAVNQQSISFILLVAWLTALVGGWLVTKYVPSQYRIGRTYRLGVRAGVMSCAVTGILILIAYFGLLELGFSSIMLLRGFKIFTSATVFLVSGWIAWRFRAALSYSSNEWPSFSLLILHMPYRKRCKL